MAADVHAANPSVFTLVDGDVPDGSLTLDQLGSRIVALSGRLSSAMCRWLLLVAEFDARAGGEYRLGFASTAQWLAYSCAVARRTALDHVRVARSLRAWPRLVEEMSAGRLSYSQVRAISRVATGPAEDSMATSALVDGLIEAAQHGAASQLEELVRGLRTVHDAEQPAQRADRERVSQGWTAKSQWAVSARLDPERGATVRTALAAVAHAEGLSAADALVRLAEIGLAALADGSARGLRGDERAAVVVHLDASRLPAVPDDAEADDAEADDAEAAEATRSAERGLRSVPFARIAGGPGLPPAVVERLTCAGRIRTVVRAGDRPHSDVLDLGRSRRLVTGRQFAALKLRDGDCCLYPGCGRRRWLEAHHVRHWLHGGTTDMDNLVLLCKAHHLAHHEGEFGVEALGGGEFRFCRQQGELPRWVDPAGLISDPEPVEHEHGSVAAAAATSRWDGTRMDHDWAISVFAQHLRLPDTA